MAPFGVRVLCIEPGFFKTNVTDSNILSKNVQMLWDKLPNDVRDDYGPEYLQKGEPRLLILVLLITSVHDTLMFTHVSLPVLAMISDKLGKMSDSDLMKVVSSMEHAVSAVRPRTRYSPGWDAKFFWLPLSYMPSRVSDYILQLEAIPLAKQL